MKLLLNTLFCPLSVICFGQNDTVFVRYMDAHGDGENYRVDTLFTSTPTENHILVGTTMLPGSGNQFLIYPYDFRFSDFYGSDCQSSESGDLWGASITDIEWSDSTLIIKCKIGENCCYDFLGDVSVDENGILNLIYHGYRGHCACNCCFGLTYVLR